MSLLLCCIGPRKPPQIQEKKKKTPFLARGVACSHGKGRLIGDQNAGTPPQRPPQDNCWEAQIIRITQTQNYWDHLCCHVEKVCLRTEAAQRKAGQEVGEKMVKLSFPLRWKREATELVVKSSRFGVIRPEFSSSWLCHFLTMLLWES